MHPRDISLSLSAKSLPEWIMPNRDEKSFILKGRVCSCNDVQYRYSGKVNYFKMLRTLV